MAGRADRLATGETATRAAFRWFAAGLLAAAMLLPAGMPALARGATPTPSPSPSRPPAATPTVSPVATDAGLDSSPAPAPKPEVTPSPAPSRQGRDASRDRRDRSRDSRNASRNSRDGERQHRTDLLPELARPQSAAPWATGAASGRGRPRGEAAPVALRDQPEADDSGARDANGNGNDGKSAHGPGSGADPGDDATAHERAGDGPRTKSEDKPLHGRIWPMPGGSYSFTQEFGCVAQIDGFYPEAQGCPSDRPVVHSGIDLAADTGAVIYAAAAGWVTQAGYDRETGLANTRLVIQHEGRNQRYATEYLHWSATFVSAGDYVRAGQPIAEVGSVGWSTGPHLHFAVIDFERGDYIDPLGWLPRRESGAYVELPRNPRPVRFDHADTTDSPLPDAADPNPAPPPTRAEVPGRRGGHERIRPADNAEARAARAERKAARITREQDRAERASERRQRIRHADGGTVTDDATAAPADASTDARDRRRGGRNDETSTPGDGRGEAGSGHGKRNEPEGDSRRSRDTRSADATSSPAADGEADDGDLTIKVAQFLEDLP